jgi:hypothetical protein
LRSGACKSRPPDRCSGNGGDHPPAKYGFGCDRILFSSDNIYQIPADLAKYRSLIADPGKLEKVLYGNIVKLYGLKI